MFQFEDDEGWTQIGDDIDGEEQGDETGRSISLPSDGSMLAVGSRNAHPRVFRYELASGWVKVGDLDLFEYDSSSVVLSAIGNILAVGNDQTDIG